MRRSVLVLVLLVAVLSLLASGTGTTTVMIYFTVGSSNGTGGPQLWRCNRDGSEPELVVADGYWMSGVAVDSANGRLFFSRTGELVVADLDGSNPLHFGTAPALHDMDNGYGIGSVAVSGGFVCWQIGEGPQIASSATDGSDLQYFECSAFPGIVDNAVIVGVGLYVHDDNAVRSTTWGRLKSRFRE